jgi:hypothetical protein
MAYEDYDDEPVSTSQALDSATQALADLDDRVRKLSDSIEKSDALIRADIAMSRKEVAEMRAAMARIQTRLDNQLVALVLANLASGVGVAALILGASRAIGG